MTDLPALAKATLEAQRTWFSARDHGQAIIAVRAFRAAESAFLQAVAAQEDELRRLREALDECAAPIPGFVGKDIGECYGAMRNEFVRRAEIARRAQATHEGREK